MPGNAFGEEVFSNVQLKLPLAKANWKKQVACSGLYSVLHINAGVLLTRTLRVRSLAAFKIQPGVAFQTGKREGKYNSITSKL